MPCPYKRALTNVHLHTTSMMSSQTRKPPICQFLLYLKKLNRVLFTVIYRHALNCGLMEMFHITEENKCTSPIRLSLWPVFYINACFRKIEGALNSVPLVAMKHTWDHLHQNDLKAYQRPSAMQINTCWRLSTLVVWQKTIRAVGGADHATSCALI